MTEYIYVIGDVHGCHTPLKKALEWIDNDVEGNRQNYKIVMLGDYIDRGPHSSAVLNTVMYYKTIMGDRFIPLMGNHEDMAINNDYGWMMNGGRETLDSYVDGEMTVEHREFIKTLPKYYETKNHIFVHAGIDDEVPMDQQKDINLLWRRYPAKHGPFIDKLLVHGHTPVRSVEYGKNRINIDTACVFGGNLTVAKFDVEKALPVDFFQVHNG
jgi:serine/threonine protein phosphatase 1